MLLGARWFEYAPGSAAAVLAVYAVVALLILRTYPGALGAVPGNAGLGRANRITLARVALALPIAGVAVLPGLAGTGVLWAVVALSLIVLALDGVDGWVARTTGTATRFGARFDMETDAALLLALSVVAWRAGPAGAWVLGIGLLRYAFVAAGLFEPRLRGDLPHEQVRRKTVCVIQTSALLVAVAPLGRPALQVVIALGALVLLLWSFAKDTRWLLRTGYADPANLVSEVLHTEASPESAKPNAAPRRRSDFPVA